MHTNARTTRQSLTVASVALCAALGVASTADAASVQLSGGSTKLTQAASTQKALAKKKVVMRAARPATRVGRRVTLPITSGSVNTVNASGRANHSGYISFGRGKKKAAITGITIRVGRMAVMTARIRGQRMTFLYLNARATRFGQAGFDLTLSNVYGRLSSKAAKALNTSLKTTAFKRGLGFTVSTGARPGRVPVASGASTIPLAQPLLDAVKAAGATLTAVSPATLTGSTLTVPVTGGSLPTVPGASGGLLNLAGALQLTKGDTTITLPLSNIALTGNTLNISGPFNLPLANLTGTLAPVIDVANHTFDFSGINAALTNQASAALQTAGITISPDTVITAGSTITAIAKALVPAGA